MVIYLSPRGDEAHAMDRQRLAGHANVQVLMLGHHHRLTVQQAVHQLSHPACTGLVVPDDYHRHNEPIEHAKACAHHMGLEVMPLTRYLLQYPPAPAQKHPVHASSETAGVGGGIPAQAQPG